MVGPILEIAKLLLGAYFSYAKLNGATDEEIEALYQDEKKNFDENKPDFLPDA
jgi:hypothetical protein